MTGRTEILDLADGTRIRVPVSDGAGLALWPSLGEYPVYNAFVYDVMTADKVRNRAYRQELAVVAAGRRVLDIGTGQHLNWALHAARCGARSVTAIEAIPDSHAAAGALLARLPERERIDLVCGRSTELALEDRFDVCVSEIIGTIGGSEGAAAVLADARDRFLVEGGTMIPHRCVTMVAGTGVRRMLPRPAFDARGLDYLRQIFDTVGHPFDVRVGLGSPVPDAPLTNAGPVETLDFATSPRPAGTESVELTVTRPGHLDGLLLWIQLYVGLDGPPIDSLCQSTSWLPIYLPVFDDPVAVTRGERLVVEVHRALSDDGIHPDYTVHVTLGDRHRTVTSTHHGTDFRASAFHAELLAPA